MKNKSIKLQSILAIALVAVMVITAASCSKSGGGGKSLNSAEDLKAYLDKQPANSPDKPIRVQMSVNDMMIDKVGEVIKNAGKYVSLDLSKSVGLTEIGFKPFRNCKALVNIIIPESVTSIEGEWNSGGAFYGTSLTSVTFLGANTSFSSGGKRAAFEGDLHDKYLAGGIGTYTRPNVDSETWTKQGKSKKDNKVSKDNGPVPSWAQGTWYATSSGTNRTKVVEITSSQCIRYNNDGSEMDRSDCTSVYDNSVEFNGSVITKDNSSSQIELYDGEWVMILFK